MLNYEWGINLWIKKSFAHYTCKHANDWSLSLKKVIKKINSHQYTWTQKTNEPVEDIYIQMITKVIRDYMIYSR